MVQATGSPFPGIADDRSFPSEWDDRLAAVLRGEQVHWQPGWPAPQVAERVRFHGLALAIIDGGGDLANWPADLIEQIREEARLQALWEASHRQLLVRILGGLAECSIDARLLKGTAIAYLAYPDPAMRRRGDSDLLIRPAQLEPARRVFERLGLVPYEEDGFGQQAWLFDTGMGFVHAIDLHWHPVGSAFLSRRLGDEAFWQDPVPLPRLSPLAQTVQPHVLLLRGTLNQALHEVYGYLQDGDYVFESERLIWLMDTALLARRFSESEWDALATRAIEWGMASMCLAMLRRARDVLGAPVPERVEARLAAAPASTPFTRYLHEASLSERISMDFGALTDWRARAHLITNQLFPEPSFMRRRFPRQAHWPLALLHARRIMGALANRLLPKRG